MWFYSFVLALLVLALAVTVHGRPASEPSPNEGCSISEQDLNDLRSALRIAASANKNLSEHILTSESKESLKACPMLANVVQTLRSVSSKLQDMKSRSADDGQIEVLRREFEEKIGEIIKSRDIFERDAEKSATQEQGAMVERITALQNEMTQLRRNIEEQTRKLYEEMAELIFVNLQLNSTSTIWNYTATILNEKLDTLFDKLQTNHRIFLGALRFLNAMKDQKLIDKVFVAILDRLNKTKTQTVEDKEMGKSVLVNLLCWTVNNDSLANLYRTKKDEIFQIALKFYPKHEDTEAKASDIRSRQYCDAKFPVNVITWFAVG